MKKEKKLLKEKFIITMLNSVNTHFHEYSGLQKLGKDIHAPDGHIYTVLADTRYNKGGIVLEVGTFNLDYDRHNQGNSAIYEDEIKEIFEKNNLKYYKYDKDVLVNTYTLYERYMPISEMFLYWSEAENISPYSNQLTKFENEEGMLDAYTREKSTFINDPYLAMYWLIYFGFSCSPHYAEVKSIIINNQLDMKLPLIEQPLSFFDESDLLFNVPELFEGDNRIKHNFSTWLWLAHSYRYQGDESKIRLWIASVIAYINPDSNLIQRVRWLKNNLKKYNAWKEFDKIYSSLKADVLFVSYVLACNPENNGAPKDADDFVNQIIDNSNSLEISPRLSFGQIMLWDIKDIVQDKIQYKKAVDIYFKDSTDNDEYTDILNALKRNNT